MDLLADIEIMFLDFSVGALISEAGLSNKAIVCLFDPNSINEMGVLSDKPQVLLKTADLTGYNRSRLTVTINGTIYSLSKPLDDGAGLTTANLKRAA